MSGWQLLLCRAWFQFFFLDLTWVKPAQICILGGKKAQSGQSSASSELEQRNCSTRPLKVSKREWQRWDSTGRTGFSGARFDSHYPPAQTTKLDSTKRCQDINSYQQGFDHHHHMKVTVWGIRRNLPCLKNTTIIKTGNGHSLQRAIFQPVGSGLQQQGGNRDGTSSKWSTALKRGISWTMFCTKWDRHIYFATGC